MANPRLPSPSQAKKPTRSIRQKNTPESSHPSNGETLQGSRHSSLHFGTHVDHVFQGHEPTYPQGFDKSLLETMRQADALRSMSSHTQALPQMPTYLATVAQVNVETKHNPVVPLADERAQTTVKPRSSHRAPPMSTDRLEGVNTKGFSLDLNWNALTWKQKASNKVRLKLLLDAGYDITPLLARGTTAESIVAAILEYKDVRSQCLQPSVVSSGVGKVQQSRPTQPAKESALENLIDNQHQDTDKDMSPSDVDVVDQINRNESIQSTYPANVQEHGQEENRMARVVSADRPKLKTCQVQSNAPTKRKRCHDDDDSLEEYTGSIADNASSIPALYRCSPVRKKARMSRKLDVDLRSLRRIQVLREVFRSSRLESAAEAVASTSATAYVSTPKASHIVLTHPDPSPNKREKPLAYMTTRSLAIIAGELKFLAHGCDSDGSINLWDPDMAEDFSRDHRSVYPDPNHHRHRIQYWKDEQGNAHLYGGTNALIGLMKRLRSNDLVHTSMWDYDGFEWTHPESLCWHLPDNAQRAVYALEQWLKAAADRGAGADLRVEQIYNGKSIEIANCWGADG